MVDQRALLTQIFDEKTVLVLEQILHKKDIFYLREVSKDSGVSLATTFRIVQKLVKMGLVDKDIQGKFNYYHIVRDTPIFEEIFSLIVGEKPNPEKIVKEYFDSKYGDVVQIWVERKTKSKFFVVGEGISKEDTTQVIADVKERIGKKITALAISQEQFNQMKEMGMINSDKYSQL